MNDEQHWGFFPDFDSEGAMGDEAAIDACVRGATIRIDGEHDDALDVSYKDARATVPKAGLWERPTPPFTWGEAVYVEPKDMHAAIDDICWHFKDERYFFYLTCDGKPVKKRYFAEDLKADV